MEILQVTCTTPGSTTAKEVVDASRAPVAGDIVIVTFTNGNSVSNPTLNINYSGPKNIRLGTTNASTTTMTVGAGGVVSLYFDGTYYNMFGSYRTSDSNSYDRMYHGVAKQMGETLYRYKLILEGIDGKFYPIVTTNQTSTTLVQKTPTNATLKIGGSILYYNTTTTVAVNEVVTNTYSELSTTRMVYSFNQNGGYQLQRPIYLVGIPQASGGYKLDSNYYTQDLPTTEDGKIYIQLGIVYEQNGLRLQIEHPIYEFKDGKVRPYIAEHTHTISQITDFPTIPNKATQTQAEAGTDNTTYMTPLRVKQCMVANHPRYVWKQQIIVQPDNSINFVTIMNNIGGTGEYLFEIIGYNGAWGVDIRLSASSSLSVSNDCIAKISFIDNEIGGTISVYPYDNTHQSRCFRYNYPFPLFYADYENSDNVVINIYRLGW